MSKLNINNNEWLELVFENKNKAYGAYQLRKQDSITSIKAFLSGISFTTGLAVLPILLSSFKDKPTNTDKLNYLGDIIVTDVHLPKKEVQKQIEKQLKQIKKADVITPKTYNLINPKVVKSTEVPENNLTKPDDVDKNISENPLALQGSITGDPKGNTSEPISTVNIPSATPKEPLTPAILEKSPEFPGGLDAFIKIISSRFQTPEIEESNTFKIFVYFVVEPDGSITNISVPRNPGFDLDKEAIRVLKSIKTKWLPGIYEGRTVRTQYSLPIIIQIN
ncbi:MULTISPECIES: energy transducer TonB [Flavobacterium]|uniref:TonB C-terminal domain-containing protein n=1 Tax=Flavobacterium columnare TaxID=996 RepID=A0AA94EY68_9FLAO|nr:MULTISPECIES: energy transducer TonB [Flavobacterium]MCH4828746.1 energy transducer TonB [Flavobacterium columnare]MCH4832000.1 energy transducer TonB [Flavobacterium columnare]QYS90434.1 energy transducer TonB [Flavobacterium covae]